MSYYPKFTKDQRDRIREAINDNEGNLMQAMRVLEAEGLKISYQSIHSYKKKQVKLSEIREKEAVRLLEINNFDYTATLKMLEKDLKLTTNKPELKKWVRKYGREICDTNKFANVVAELTEEVAISHKALAEKIYEAREKIVDRIILMIPDETDMNKLSIAYKTLTEVLQPSELAKQPLTLISQYNAYYKDRNNGKENRDTRNIEDATTVSE